MRRAACERELELRRIEVDGDDRLGAGETERRDDLQSDTAAADHGSRLTRPNPRGIAYRAERRHDAAAEQRRLPQRELARERHRSRGRHDRAFGEAGSHECVLERRAVRQREPRRSVHEDAEWAVLAGREAEVEAACAALLAHAARRHDAEADVIARCDVRHRRAYCFDHSRALVPHDHRPAPAAELAVRQPHVRVTHARGRDAHEHLVVAGRRELDLFDHERLPRLVEDGGANPHQPTRYCSSTSKSGTTPRPGPSGGPIVPSAAISSVTGSSQSRRSADQAGGSNGTSM